MVMTKLIQKSTLEKMITSVMNAYVGKVEKKYHEDTLARFLPTS